MGGRRAYTAPCYSNLRASQTAPHSTSDRNAMATTEGGEHPQPVGAGGRRFLRTDGEVTVVWLRAAHPE